LTEGDAESDCQSYADEVLGYSSTATADIVISGTCIQGAFQDTLLKDWQSSLVSPHPIRILFICCIYFTLIMHCTLIGWFKSSHLFISLSVSVCHTPIQRRYHVKKLLNLLLIVFYYIISLVFIGFVAFMISN